MVKSYVKYRVVSLDQVEIAEGFLDDFERKQVVRQRYSIKSGEKSLENIRFIDDWSKEERRYIVRLFLMKPESQNYYSAAVFDKGQVIGFMVLCKNPIGINKEYLEIKELQVAETHRRKGIGKLLFNHAIEIANLYQTSKLYLSTHSARESQEFYQALGCKEATWLSAEAVKNEPYDIQMEYVL